MQNEHEKQGGRFFVLIQKLNFIFASQSFNEMNIYFCNFKRELNAHDFIFVTRWMWILYLGVSLGDFCQFDFSERFDGLKLDVKNVFRELLYYATCDNVGRPPDG